MKQIYHPLQFIKPGGTSRGVLKQKKSWFLTDGDKDDFGIGEISIIEGLSKENFDVVNAILLDPLNHHYLNSLSSFPAIAFGVEILERSLRSSDPFNLFSSDFCDNGRGIPINGLVWMGSKKHMFDQIKDKIDQGYKCLKLKIGAIDFEEELSLLKYVRSQFGPEEIELRVDANGAFSVNDAMEKLNLLSSFELHSIEQPIKPTQYEEMAHLCSNSPLPIALDEELIGISSCHEKRELLETVKPQYIILKPSLIGGFQAADDWINVAESMNIAWWATSALESNIGLNAIAQWISTKTNNMPQGLGTGQLYSNNINSPLKISRGSLFYDQNLTWDLTLFKSMLE